MEVTQNPSPCIVSCGIPGMPEREGSPADRCLVCRHAPFLIAFEERAQVFQTVITADRSRRREMGAYGPQSFVTIHRDTLMQVRTYTHIFWSF